MRTARRGAYCSAPISTRDDGPQLLRVAPQDLALRSFARSMLQHLITTSSCPWRTPPCPEPRAKSRSASPSAKHVAARSRSVLCPKAPHLLLRHCPTRRAAKAASTEGLHASYCRTMTAPTSLCPQHTHHLRPSRRSPLRLSSHHLPSADVRLAPDLWRTRRDHGGKRIVSRIEPAEDVTALTSTRSCLDWLQCCFKSKALAAASIPSPTTSGIGSINS